MLRPLKLLEYLDYKHTPLPLPFSYFYRYHMFTKTDEEILKVTDGAPVTDTNIAYIVRSSEEGESVWGLRSMVSIADPKLMMHYERMLETLIPPLETFEQHPEYSVSWGRGWEGEGWVGGKGGQ